MVQSLGLVRETGQEEHQIMSVGFVWHFGILAESKSLYNIFYGTSFQDARLQSFYGLRVTQALILHAEGVYHYSRV